MAVIVRHKLTVNNATINKIEKAQKKCLFMTVDALKTDVIQSQVMPFDTGTMQNDSTYVATSHDNKHASLITRTPYALRLYYHPEYHFQKKNNPNAKGRWLDDYLVGDKEDFCKNAFAKFLRKELKK